MSKTFVLSDESLNSQGFRVMTGGIDLSQFKKNPVMLFSHDSDALPIGVWENVRVEGDRLLADAKFDQQDEFAKKVESKVEQGILKCCSIGFRVLEWSEDPAMLLPGQRYDTVTKALLMECSICSIGANHNAMSLYDAKGERMELTEEKMLSLGFKRVETQINKLSMTQEEINTLQEENKTLKEQMAEQANELKTLRDAAAAQHKANIEGALSAAVKDGRIVEGDREKWGKLMEADFDSAKSLLENLPKRTSLSEMIQGGSKGGNAYDGKSWDELDKAGQLAAFKESNPEGFATLYKKTFGVEYK